MAGRGGRSAGPEIAALAEAGGALLATSAVANGLFVQDPFSLGISGGFSSPFTAATIADADLIVGWGCALNMWTMRHGSLIGAGATVVQVDVEDSGLGANRPIDLGVLGDCAADRRRGAGAAARRGPHRRRAAHPGDGGAGSPPNPAGTTCRPRTSPRRRPSIRACSAASWTGCCRPSGSCPSTPATSWATRAPTCPCPDEFGFCFTQAFQSIGLGLYTAIGAATARPDRLPVLGTGDGGFLMSISELETAVREGIPLVAIVYNDSAYGAEVHHFDVDDEDLEVVRFPLVDIASIARGYGAAAVTVRTVEDLAGVTEWLRARARRRWSSTRASPPTAARGGWRRRSRATSAGCHGWPQAS